MLAHQADIEDLVEAWKKLKNGKRLSNTYRWRDYPLQLRRDLNSLIEEVRREMESGYWVVDGKARALCGIRRPRRWWQVGISPGARRRGWKWRQI